MRQQKITLTAILALMLFLSGVGLAITSPAALSILLRWGLGTIGIIGACILCLTSFRRILLKPKTEIAFLSMPMLPLTLWIWQSLLFIVTFICFNVVLMQSQLITRLQPLEAEQLFGLFKQNVWTLGILPWLLYGVVGVGLAYFTFCKNATPLLHHIIVPAPTKQFYHFVRSMFAIINEITISLPFLFLVGIAILLLSESLCAVWGWPSPLAFSVRTAVVWFLIIFFYRKKHTHLVEWMELKQISMGGRLVIYTIGLSGMLLAYQALWVLMPMPVDTSTSIHFVGPTDRSLVVGKFSDSALHTRLQLFIIGWWVIWLPWMASLVARYSIGYSVWQAIVNALMVPLLFFFGWGISSNGWQVMTTYFQHTSVQLMSVLICLGFIWVSLRTVHNFSDLAKGAMISSGKLPKRALKKTLSAFIMRLMAYLYGGYILGWFPMQVIATVGAMFIFIVVVSFVIVLGLELNKTTIEYQSSTIEPHGNAD